MDVNPINMVAIGDCNTRGVDWSAGKAVPDFVVAGLRERGHDCSLVNLGITSSTTREGVAKLRDHAGPIDLLLVNFGLTDAWTTSIPGVYVSYYPDHFLKVWGRKLLKAVKRRLRSPLVRQWLPVGEVVPMAEYDANLRTIVALARARSPQCRIVLWGTTLVQNHALRNDMIARYNAVMRSVAETSSCVDYCETSEALAGHPLDNILLDDVHLGAFAAQQVADAILRLWAAQSPPQVTDQPAVTPQRLAS